MRFGNGLEPVSFFLSLLSPLSRQGKGGRIAPMQVGLSPVAEGGAETQAQRQVLPDQTREKKGPCLLSNVPTTHADVTGMTTACTATRKVVPQCARQGCGSLQLRSCEEGSRTEKGRLHLAGS